MSPYQQTVREIAEELVGQDNWQDLLDTAIDGVRDDVLSLLHLNKQGKPTKLDLPAPVLPSCPGFTCPDCGSHRLEECMSDVCVSSEIIEAPEDGDLEYGDQNNDGGVVDRYQCLNCGWKVPCEPDCDALGAWIAEQAKKPAKKRK